MRNLLRRSLLSSGLAGLATTACRPATRSEVRQGPELSQYRRTFSAEFDNPDEPMSIHDGGPFTTRYEEWGGLRTLPKNDELELYVDKAFVPAATGTDEVGHADAAPGKGVPLGYNPFAIRDGCLEISAVPVPPPLRARVDRPYLSGMISTEWSFTQQYGYFEIRAQLPAGRGLWPAFWMVSKTNTGHFELDVMEAIGEGNRVYHSVHVPAPVDGFHVARRLSWNYAEAMHTYGVLWTEQELVFLLDGVESYRADGTPLRGAPPMYMLANLAVGGSWPGRPSSDVQFPAIMRIDHIRAYQRA